MVSPDTPSDAAISEARRVGAAVSCAMMCLWRAIFERRSPSVFRGRLSAPEASLVCSGSLVIEVSSPAQPSAQGILSHGRLERYTNFVATPSNFEQPNARYL